MIGPYGTRRPPRPHPFERLPKAAHTSAPRARARVYKRGDTWFFETSMGARIVDQDNTGHWRTMFDAAFESAVSFDHVSRAGHRIKKSFGELVDQGRGAL